MAEATLSTGSRSRKRYIPPHKRHSSCKQQDAASICDSHPNFNQPHSNYSHRNESKHSAAVKTSRHDTQKQHSVVTHDDDRKQDEHVHEGACTKKYVPPFRMRRLRQNMQEEKRKETRKQDTIDAEHYPPQYIFFHTFYMKQSKFYEQWLSVCRNGWSNKHLEQFFDSKHKNQNKVSRGNDKNIVPLFRRFYRYAIDIDNVCGYKQHLLQILRSKNSVYFLDMGFAPGGMSRFLLDGHEAVYGVGITLPPYESGNAFIKELLSSPRFLCREHDIIAMAKKMNNKSDFVPHCIKHDYSTQKSRKSNSSEVSSEYAFRANGFDLVIIGITCHQDFHENHYLSHHIVMSELYVAFLTLNNGGSVLIRHKINIDYIHQHILYIFLQCFEGYQRGKPLTEFAKNRTFWVLWKGFDRAKCDKLNIVSALRRLIHEHDERAPPYGIDSESVQYFNPKMVDSTPQQMVCELQDEMINIMDPMFEIQMKSLKGFCEGKKDKLCVYGSRCQRLGSGCHRAHRREECIDGLYEALQRVDAVMENEVNSHAYHSQILAALRPGRGTGNRNKQKKHSYYQNRKRMHRYQTHW